MNLTPVVRRVTPLGQVYSLTTESIAARLLVAPIVFFMNDNIRRYVSLQDRLIVE